MRARITVMFAVWLSFSLSHCEADPPDPTETRQERATSTANQWTIKGRVFSKSRSVNAAEFGLTAGNDSDQSSALAKAIQRASESPDVDTVYVPEGVYLIADSIRLKPGVNMIGAAAGKTVFERRDESDYLFTGKHMDCRKAIVANLTLRNRDRTLLISDIRNLQFSNVEFAGGIVRFEHSSHITLDGNTFNDNRGKSAYASSDCEHMKIVNNVFNSVEHGSINLSGHRNSYVASNRITSPKPIDSGYAGIRLPNRARNNVVEKNVIENHGRGIFILSSSEENTIRNNVVKRTTQQGVLIQSSNNIIRGNTIIDAGRNAIYVVDQDAASATPRRADGNSILSNVILDTSKRDGSFVGLRISARNTIVRGNQVSKQHGRGFKAIKAEAGNQDTDNSYTADPKRQPRGPSSAK